MKTIIKLIAVVIILSTGVSIQIANAQDTIIKKNGDIIKAKISEVGTEEVKFKLFNNPDGPTVIMKKDEVKIMKSGGQTLIDDQENQQSKVEDVIVKKNGETIKAKVTEIGTEEVKFKLGNDPDGPTMSIKKSEIKNLKIGGETVIDDKSGNNEAVITKKDGGVIKAKISEMGPNEVKFKLNNNPDGPTMTLRKSEIKNIKLDGQIIYEYVEDPMSATNESIIGKTSTFKFYFLSPLNHNLAFGYEWMDKPGFNWDVAMGVIGLGITPTDNTNPKGLFLRAGPKFLLGSSSDIVTGDGEMKQRYAHPLKGKYIKVEVILNAFSSTNTVDTGYQYLYYNNGNYTTGQKGKMQYKNQYQSITLNLQYGRQYIFGNAMTLAWYIGVGYSIENKTSNLPTKYKYYDEFDGTRYSHTFMGSTFPMVMTGGVTVGYIFKTPSWISRHSAGYDKSAPRHFKEGGQMKRKT